MMRHAWCSRSFVWCFEGNNCASFGLIQYTNTSSYLDNRGFTRTGDLMQLENVPGRSAQRFVAEHLTTVT